MLEFEVFGCGLNEKVSFSSLLEMEKYFLDLKNEMGYSELVFDFVNHTVMVVKYC